MSQLFKKLVFSFLTFVLFLYSVQLQSQTTPSWNPALNPGGANSMLFKFTKQVWLNPSIILIKQNFEQATQVKLLILPRLNSKDTSGSSKIEKSFDKLLSFLVYKDNVQGSIKFYFDPQNPAKPFSFNTSEELWCKFTAVQKDTVEQLLNQQIANSNNLTNFSALPFDSIISQTSRYCKKILKNKPGQCGPDPDNEFNLTAINSTPARLNFERVTKSSFPNNGNVDVKKYSELAQYYNSVTDAADNSNYEIAWKAMVANSNDVIKLKLKKKQDNFDISKLVFKNTSGTETYNTTFQSADSTISLSIGGKAAGSMAEVVAYYTPPGGAAQTYPIGAFNVQFYQVKPTLKVVLVNLSADDKTVPDEKTVEDELNSIYGNVFVNWDVSIAKCTLQSAINKNIHIESSGLLSNYMPDMQPVISYFKDNCSVYKAGDNDTYYLLFGCSNDGSLLGYMPRARNIGFIFDKMKTPHTIAHELGHGAFNLKHIFSSDELGEGNRYQTDNLMDYASDNSTNAKQQDALYKHQWDFIHDPSFVGWFDGDDEDAEILANQNYFTPAGLPFHATETAITLLGSSEIENGNRLNGILYAFTTSDEQTYTAKIADGKFYGYFLPDKTTPYNDQTNFKAGAKIKVKSIHYMGNCQVNYYLRDYTLKDNVSKLTYENGAKIITSFTATDGEKIGKISIIKGCSDDNGDLPEGSIGKILYAKYSNLIKPTDAEALAELKRIGNLVNKLGTDLFNARTQALAWNDNMASDIFRLFYYPTPEPKWDKATLNAAYLSIKKYADAVIQFNQLTASGNFTTTQLKEIVNQNFVCCNSLKRLFTAPFDQLNVNQRNNILKVFLNDEWVTGRKNIGSDFQNEDIVVSTIITADASQHKSILNFLNDNKLIYKFVKNVDGDNFEAMASTLTKWVLTEFPPSNIDLIKAIKNKQLLHFNDDYFGRKNTEQILQDNKIVLVVQKWSGPVEYSIFCDPYEYIEVTFQNDFTLGSGTDAASFLKNTPYKLPALYVYLLFNADTKAKWMTSGKIAVDVGLLIIGVGEIKAAVQAGEWTTASLAIADMGIGFGDIVINTAFKNEIQTSYPKFFEAWQKISFCYGIGRMAQVGLTAAYKRCYVESKLIKSKSTFSETTQSTAHQIENKLQDEANFAEFIDESALASELAFFTNVDNHYPRVTGKIGQMDDETRLAFYDDFKSNPDNTLQTLENNPSQVDDWVNTRQVNNAKNILTQRTSFWEDWIAKCFPGKNWSNTTFETLGKDYNVFKSTNAAVDNEMRSFYNSASDADKYLPGVVNSGSTSPVEVIANQGDKYYKIVPKGGNINSPSPYYLSETDFNWIKANPSQLEQKLGLPLSSVSAEYDVFTITSKTGKNKLFQSTVAPTKQFSNATPNVIYETSGGKTQSLILNNADPDFWLKSANPIETITPNNLPQIGN